MTVAQFRSALTKLVQEHDPARWSVGPVIVACIADSELEALMLKVLECSKCGAEHEGPAICEPCGRWEFR